MFAFFLSLLALSPEMSTEDYVGQVLQVGGRSYVVEKIVAEGINELYCHFSVTAFNFLKQNGPKLSY